MRNTMVLIATVLLGGLSSLPAHAQWNNYGYNGTVVRCESRDGRTERCSTGGGDTQLVRQFSDNACIRNRTWGTDSRGIWVSSGCRAEFRVERGYGYHDDDYGYGGNSGYNSGYGNGYGYASDGTFRCESRDNRTTRCGSGGRAEFVRQLSNSPCIRGQTWGSDSRGVWVSGGCRALFRTGYGNGGYGNGGYGGSDLVRCESRDNRSRSCNMSVGRNGEIRLLRQLSDKPCVEGRTWGQTRSGVWVTQGCRAEFVVSRRGSRSGDGWDRPPGDLGDDRPPGG
jgi:hypothetical protein